MTESDGIQERRNQMTTML
jgi:hypothetical protein